MEEVAGAPRRFPFFFRRKRKIGQKGCNVPLRFPNVQAEIIKLKNIGPYLAQRWLQEGVTTLQDLVNLVRNHTIAQNMRIFKRVFANARAKQCVSDAKAWDNPWPDPPYKIRNREGLTSGQYKYCVRPYNNCGWMTVEAFLRRTHYLTDDEKQKVPALPERTEYCRNKRPSWCKTDEEEEERGQISSIMDKGRSIQRMNEQQRHVELRRRYGELFDHFDATDLQKIALVLRHNNIILDAGDIATFTRLTAQKVSRLIGNNRGNKGLKLFRVPEKSKYQLNLRFKNEPEQRFLNRIGLNKKKKQKRGGSSTISVVINYYVSDQDPESEQEIANFREWVKKTLGDPRKGVTALTGIQYREVAYPEKAQIIVRLVSQKKVNDECLLSNLSCSVISNDPNVPDEILFSLDNWMGQSRFDSGSLDDYRIYLINHEFLHCRPFHRNHPSKAKLRDLCSRGLPTPVMYQQSLGLPPNYNCTPNVWPTDLKHDLVHTNQEFIRKNG